MFPMTWIGFLLNPPSNNWRWIVATCSACPSFVYFAVEMGTEWPRRCQRHDQSAIHEVSHSSFPWTLEGWISDLLASLQSVPKIPPCKSQDWDRSPEQQRNKVEGSQSRRSWISSFAFSKFNAPKLPWMDFHCGVIAWKQIQILCRLFIAQKTMTSTWSQMLLQPSKSFVRIPMRAREKWLFGLSMDWRRQRKPPWKI